jgi:hypothetical protein
VAKVEVSPAQRAVVEEWNGVLSEKNGQIADRQRVPLTLKHPKRGSALRNGPL